MFFSFGGLDIEYPPHHFYGIVETFLLDVYRTSMIKPGDVVVDLGAGIGDFAILAASRGAKVIALEPNKEDYDILKRNTQGQPNIIPINKGVAAKQGFHSITFEGRTFTFEAQSLNQILYDQHISKVDVVKMDIEGFETEVLKSSLDIIKYVRLLPIELHNTKVDVDCILEPLGFKFKSVTRYYLLRQMIKQVIFDPIRAFTIYSTLKRKRPHVDITLFRSGPDITNYASGLLVGTYVRENAVKNSSDGGVVS